MSSLGPFLEELLATTDTAARIASDPVRFVHRYDDRDDQQVAAFLAAGLAFGRVAAFGRVLDEVFSALDQHGGPATASRALPRGLRGQLAPVVYRWIRGPHLWVLLGALGDELSRLDEHQRHGTAREGLGRLVRALRAAVVQRTGVGWAEQPRGVRYLLPDPLAGAACKRLCMLHRWMVRPADGIDLGLWTRDPSTLVIPVDTHVQRIARFVGLTDRRDASWRTAEEITAALRRIDPDDPVRFDFALAHLGISGDCRGARHPEACPRCPLERVCRA